MKKDKIKISRGKLKIFLGISAGAGKTYTMLCKGRLLKSENIDVIAGFIESYGRKDIIVLLKDIETIPGLKINYKNSISREIDTEAILNRKPHVVLIDELAHINAPESRHKKRYQDILELLENGIDVYTTLNIQNIESLAPAVEEITGVKINDTVPDSILETAENIELVDITNEEDEY